MHPVVRSWRTAVGRAAACAAVALAASVALAACASGGATAPSPTAATTPRPAATLTSPASPSPAAPASPAASASGSAPGANVASGATVDIAGFAFVPADLEVSVGTTVTWTNGDAAPHTVTFQAGGPRSSGRLDTEGTFSATFDQAGSFPYICSIHPSMKGTVTVSG